MGDTLVSQDESGEHRIWSFPSSGPRLERMIPPRRNAPPDAYAEASGRWLFDEYFRDRRVQLTDLRGLPGTRALELRRSGFWGAMHGWDFGPGGDWFVLTTEEGSRLTFWPVGRSHPSVMDGYPGVDRPLAFSPDSRWLAATAWQPLPIHLAEGRRLDVQLWALPGTGHEGVRTLAPDGAIGVAFDPQGRFLVRLGAPRDPNPPHPVRGLHLLPLDGSPLQEVPESTDLENLSYAVAVSPSGRRVATACFFARTAERQLHVWDLDTGQQHAFDLPASALPDIGSRYQKSVTALHFESDSTLYTAGDGGLRRWDLDTGSHELVWAPEPPRPITMSMSADGRMALTGPAPFLDAECRSVAIHDLATNEHRELPEFGTCVRALALDPSGLVAATGDVDGAIRVGRLSGDAPHLLYGHEAPVQRVALSPDLEWVASTAEDDTLRLWPMPDLDQPPLHVLPHEELVAQLRSLTNIRAVRDPEDSTGWRITLDPFPGWEEVPGW
jgi:WD40 repeat protein